MISSSPKESEADYDKNELYGLCINRKPGIYTVSINFFERWNSILNKTVQKLVELLLTEAAVVSKPTENKFEKKNWNKLFKKIVQLLEKVNRQLLYWGRDLERKWLNIKTKKIISKKVPIKKTTNTTV